MELEIAQTSQPKSVADGRADGMTNRRTDGVDPLLTLRFAKATHQLL